MAPHIRSVKSGISAWPCRSRLRVVHDGSYHWGDLDGTGMGDTTAHLWVQFIDSANRLFDASIFNGLSNLHPLLNHGLVDRLRNASFACERDGGARKALDHEVVENYRIEVAEARQHLRPEQVQERRVSSIRSAK